MTFALALVLLWVGVNGLHSPDAAWTTVGAVLLVFLAARNVRNAVLVSQGLGRYDDSTEEGEPERGHGGRLTPWN